MLRTCRAVVLAVLSIVDVAHAVLRVVPTARVTVDARVDVTLIVTSAGDETARSVVPEVALGPARRTGEAVAALPGGGAVTWRIWFPRPQASGVVPALVRVRYDDVAGDPHSAVAVAPVAFPGASPGPVQASFPSHELDIDQYYLVPLTIRNDGDHAVVGRVSTFAADDLLGPPPTAAEIPAGSSIDVPLVFENRTRRAGDVASVAVAFEYALEGAPNVAVAHTVFTLRGPPPPTPGWTPAVALAVVLVVLLFVALANYRSGRPPWRRRGVRLETR